MSARPRPKYTLEEYLKLDRKSEARLEYWNGEVFDTSGVSPQHDQIESNLHYHLRARLEGRNCHVFLANMRIKVSSAPPYRYSDSSALCGEPQYETIEGLRVLTNPALIVEVLSDSTEAYDRGDKFTHYKSILSFREYLLVAQHRPHLSHFVRQDEGSWTYREYNDLEAVVKLAALDCALTMREVYEHVAFDESATNPHLRPVE
jgi:Uma2 family endonuclease